jgi:hypothetical protein
MKYKEAADLAAESPQGILRTPDTVAKFQVRHPLTQSYYLIFTRFECLFVQILVYFSTKQH